MAACHICGREAVERCYSCGELFCEVHGKVNCSRCETAIVAGDNRPDRISATPLRQHESRPAWWRPQLAEDVEIPACHTCKGLARLKCKNCDQYYCGEHAGPHGLCRECGRSSLMGLAIFVGTLAVLGVLLLWGKMMAP